MTPSWLLSVDITGVDRIQWKYINKKERESRWGYQIAIPRYQHPITSLGLPHPYLTFSSLAAPANFCQSSSSADEGHSAGWNLQYFIYFHLDLSTPVMSVNTSQVFPCSGIAQLLSIFNVVNAGMSCAVYNVCRDLLCVMGRSYSNHVQMNGEEVSS